MLSILWSFLTFIGALILLITVHECGHFLAARCCGVKVERFSIGFGKVLWRHIDSYGTEYVISLIPIGGYVKMLDERIDNISDTFSYQAFNNKTTLQRAIIITAGSIANFIFAILIYWIVFINGVSVVRPVIGEILHGSVAEKSHVLSGMEIKAVDNIATPDWDVVRMVLLSKIGDTNAILTVAKFGENQIQKKQINLYKWHFDPDKQDPVIALGIRPYSPKIDLVIKDIQARSPAYYAGFQSGDKIIKVNGQLVKQWQDLTVQVRGNPYKKILIEIDRNGKPIELQMVPKAKLTNRMEGFAGITPRIIPFPEEYKLVKRYGVFNAIEASVLKTWQIMKLTASMLGKLIIGDVKLNNLSGPISIAQGARLSAEYGLTYYLMFLALISINLGMLNLFPFPVLDGGHLLFLIIEKIKGGTVSERVQNFSYRIGSILLMLLMGLALFNDFLHLLVSRM